MTKTSQNRKDECRTALLKILKPAGASSMISFTWQRCELGNTVHHILRDTRGERLGQCFYMPGSKRYRCAAGAPVKNGVVLTEYWGGTMRAAMDHLERDWSKRSIGLFGEDDIEFVVLAP